MDAAQRERTTSTPDAELVTREKDVQVREEAAQKESAVLEVECQRRASLKQEEHARWSKHTRALQSLVIRSRAALISLNSEASELGEEADDIQRLRVFEEIAPQLEGLQEALKKAINIRNGFYVKEVASRIFTNVQSRPRPPLMP